MSRSRTLTASAALLLALTFVLQWLAARHHSFSLLTAQLGLLIATLGVFATGILARLFRPGPVTLHRILGAVGAYLLVGLMWALAYLALQLNIPGAVQFQADRGVLPPWARLFTSVLGPSPRSAMERPRPSTRLRGHWS